MQLVERSLIGSIAIAGDGRIEVRRDDFIMRGDEIVAGPQYHRHVLAPGDSLEAEDQRVVAVAGAVWTHEVVAAFAQNAAAGLPA